MRIECKEEGYVDCWIEYRDKRWPFKDRRAITESNSDMGALSVILSYATNWYLKDVDGALIPFSEDKRIEAIGGLDDLVMIPWLVRSWFDARASRVNIPK